MTGHDLPTPDESTAYDADGSAAADSDATEKHKIRYNPSSRTRDDDTADGDRIRYNPSRSTD